MKTLKFMLAVATAVGLASAAQAAQKTGASTGFEKLAQGTKVGSSVVDNDSKRSYFWYAGATAEDNESEIVAATGLDDVTRPTGVAKFTGADATSRANALQVSTGTDPLLRTFLEAPADGNLTYENLVSSTYVDTLVQFTVTPATDTVTPSAADKLMIYLKETSTVTDNDDGTQTTVSSTNLAVTAGYLQANMSSAAKVYTAQNVSVKPGEWYRLTVEAIPAKTVNSIVGEQLGLVVFKIKINDTPCKFDSMPGEQAVIQYFETFAQDAFNKQVVLSLQASTSGADTKNKLQAVGFAGEGLVDDLVITTTDPAATVVNFTLVTGEGVNVVEYTIGGVSYATNIEGKEIEDVPVGSTVTVGTVHYAEGYEFDSISGLLGLTAVAGSDNSFTVDANASAASLTINAKSSASAGYPEYIPAEDATVKGLYDAWKANVAGEGDVSAAQNQFLLNTTASNEAAAGNATLKITSIAQNANGGWDIVVGCTVEGVKLTGSIDSYQVCNGYLAIEYASELGAAAWTKENIAVSAVDAEAGTVTVNVNKPEAKFLKAELSLTKAPTPTVE